MRSYIPADAITFRKTNESFGGLSNMASGFVLWVNGTRILTSEALYQACRFPHLPEVQRSIIMQGSPMTAKMKSKPYREQSRADWDQVRVNIMRWCLRVKLAQNWDAFSELLLRTGDKPIVEDSRKDRFWGAVMNDQGVLEGRNALGRLLMELREELKGANREVLRMVQPIDIPDFLLYGQPIGLVEAKTMKPDESAEGRRLQPFGTRWPDESVKTYAPPAAKVDLFSEPKQTMEVHEPKPQEPLTPYPAYKPAGVPWLKQVPEHWEIQSMGSLTTSVTGRNRTDLPLLSVVREKGVILRSSMLDGENHNRIPDDLSNYKYVRKGNLVINKMKAWQGSLGIAPTDGIVSPAYYVFDLHVAEPMFGHVLLRSKPYVGAFAAYSDGVRIGQWDLSIHGMRRIPVLLPPPDEQHLIVRYLHALDAKVKRYIRTKRSLIARLQEQKQAIIQRAVTRGLDPKVKLKPSGVEWLGEVPEHWEVLRCRFLFREIDKRSVEGKETHLSMSQTLGLVPSDQVENRTLVSESYAGGKLCEANDLVLNRLKAHLGVFALAPQEGVISPDYSVFRGMRPMVMRYFEQVLRSPDCRHELRIRAKGIVEGFWRLYTDDFNDIFLPVPPVDEQATILRAMDEELKGVHEAIRRIENEIGLMQEYHTRLIADVVTGAVDVRAAAKAMETEVEEVLEEEPLSMAAEGEAEYGEEEN